MKEFAEVKGQKIEEDDPVKVVKSVKEIFNCQSESCIFKKPEFQRFMQINDLNQYLDSIFKPVGPDNQTAWLSNHNIDSVLDQLGKKFPDRKFLHIPFQMRDFEKVGTDLANVDLAQKFKEGYKTFGVVINTDYSDGSGIHWFPLFGENYDDRISLEYFNSSGARPLPEIYTWLSKTKHYLEKNTHEKKKVDLIIHSGIRYQQNDYACGLYSIAYIWLRLEGVPARWFNKKVFNDDLMKNVWHSVFRKEK
jgi:hypothetical protein